MKQLSVIQERVYAVPASRIWSAITDRKEMKQWYFDIPDFEAKKGFVFEFYGGDREHNRILHRCEITEVITEQVLEHTWTYPEKDHAASLVRWELHAESDQTRVILRHSGLENFPQDDPSFSVDSFTQGWTMILNELLEKHLAG